MTDYKNEYQKYADDAVRSRAREEGFGRLRFSLFWGVAGPLACFLVHLLKFDLQHWMSLAIVGTAPLAILLLVVNFIRLPNDAKASPPALLISLMTLLGAGATLALSKVWEIWK
ncbi:MAG TPA: hypothetical protein VKW04_04135 [Planctomycetota bacterium]|nr:hypothetical protein [Planctomycetota bacterium]